MSTPSPESQSPVRTGEVLAGKYRVEHVLGVGGMGVVVAAQHIQLGQRVALKFLLPATCGDPDAVSRFLREARAAVQLRSEHVAQVLDVGELANGAPYMVMEFLRGRDLGKHLDACGALPVADAVDYVLQASVAVAEAHALGIVHRDLKPSNLFLTTAPGGIPQVKVLDFGIAKALRPQGSQSHRGLTTTRSIIGSPSYMAPEQLRNKNIDTRADIWALGVVLYELLSAALPFGAFEDDTYAGLCLRIQLEPPVPLRKVRPDIPPKLEEVILRCLEKDPARRWSYLADLARELLPFAPSSARPLVPQIERILGMGSSVEIKTVPPLPSTPPPEPISWGGTFIRSAKRRALWIAGWAAAAVLVLLIGLAGIYYGAKYFADAGARDTRKQASSEPPRSAINPSHRIDDPAPIARGSEVEHLDAAVAPVTASNAGPAAVEIRPARGNTVETEGGMPKPDRQRSSRDRGVSTAAVSKSMREGGANVRVSQSQLIDSGSGAGVEKSPLDIEFIPIP